MIMFPAGFLFCAVTLLQIVHAQVSENYDEVEKFNEILQIDNPLVVLFSEECCACTDCVEAEVLLGGMSQDLEVSLGAIVVRLKKPNLRSRYGIKKVPALVYIRNKKVATYDRPFEFDTLYSWLQENKEPATVDLNDETFEHLTQASSGATTGDWLVVFHDNSLSKNRALVHLENAGVKLRSKVNVAAVNVKESPETAHRFKVQSCPSIIFFRHQKMYRYSLHDVTATNLIRFSEGFYKNSLAENVPQPQSAFDKFTDKVVEKTKQFYNDYWYSLLVFLALTTVCTTTLLVCAILTPAPRKKTE